MANAEFLKKLGLKPHVPAAPAVPQPDVLANPVAAGPSVRPATDVPAASESAKAPAKPQGLQFKIGGKPVSQMAGAPESPRVAGESASAGESAAATGLVPVSHSGRAVDSQLEELPAPNADHPGAVSLNVEPTTESFQDLLNQFDAMVGQVGQITQLELDVSRKFVARIMTDLVTHPELDGLIIDRDVHNVMKFVQASSAMANKNFVTSQERKQKKNDRAAAAGNISLEALDFGVDVEAEMAALKAKAKGKAIPAGKMMSIADLSAMNIDAIEAKDKR